MTARRFDGAFGWSQPRLAATLLARQTALLKPMSCSDTWIDLILLDVNLGASSGIDLAIELAAADPALRIVLVSTMEERDLPSHVRQVGAIGFVEKSRLGPELVHLLTQASPSRECWHSPEDTI